MIFSPLKTIFPLETKKFALYAPEQNVPSVEEDFDSLQSCHFIFSLINGKILAENFKFSE